MSIEVKAIERATFSVKNGIYKGKDLDFGVEPPQIKLAEFLPTPPPAPPPPSLNRGLTERIVDSYFQFSVV